MTTSYALGRVTPRRMILDHLAPSQYPRFAFYLNNFISENHARKFSTVVETKMPFSLVVLTGMDGFVLLECRKEVDTCIVEKSLTRWHLETACE